MNKATKKWAKRAAIFSVMRLKNPKLAAAYRKRFKDHPAFSRILSKVVAG